MYISFFSSISNLKGRNNWYLKSSDLNRDTRVWISRRNVFFSISSLGLILGVTVIRFLTLYFSYPLTSWLNMERYALYSCYYTCNHFGLMSMIIKIFILRIKSKFESFYLILNKTPKVRDGRFDCAFILWTWFKFCWKHRFFPFLFYSETMNSAYAYFKNQYLRQQKNNMKLNGIKKGSGRFKI